MKNCRTWSDSCCFIAREHGIEIWNWIAEGKGLETVLSKGNRAWGSELIWVSLLQSLHSALRVWDQAVWWMASLAGEKSSSSCEGSIGREAICRSNYWACQKMIQTLKKARQKSRVHFHLSGHGLDSNKLVPGPFGFGSILLIWLYGISQKAHSCSLHLLLCKRTLNRLCFPWLWL